LQLDSDEKMSRFFDGCRKNNFLKNSFTLELKKFNFLYFFFKWNGNVARIVFCHCGYEGCNVLKKIKVLISSSGRATFKYFSSSTGSFPTTL
jgi:hypothetical protein